MNGRSQPAGRPSPAVRFIPSDIPVLTSTPARADDAVRAAGRALARLGRSHLGGHLVLMTGRDGLSDDRTAREVAVARAVEHALRRRGEHRPLTGT
ncbi:hypothetical protein ACFUIY_35100 [Streptomyces griseorubiginosus]|uniref:hypothetical protein n=1 Tax=Streptomyces griseorubiginosus TaxID=67304 RepID=UPI00363550FB